MSVSNLIDTRGQASNSDVLKSREALCQQGELRMLVYFSPGIYFTHGSVASLVAQRSKRLPVMQETWVWSLGQEDPLEKEMATHSSFLAWRIPWREEPGRLQSTGLKRVGHNWATSLSVYMSVLISPCIHSPPSLTVSTSPFSVSASPLFPCR